MYSVSHTYNKKHVFQAHLMENILTPTCVFVTFVSCLSEYCSFCLPPLKAAEQGVLVSMITPPTL